MAYSVQEIRDKKIWEDFLAACSEKTFLQSWNWGEFSSSMGEKIWRFGVFEGNDLVAAALTVKKAAKRGTFLLVPHGPVVQSDFKFPISNFKLMEQLTRQLRTTAKEEGASLIRVNPVWTRNEENERVFRALGFRNAPIQMHPESSWKLSIAPAEETLLAAMRKTTRYLIRQGMNNPDITVSHSQDPEDVRLFSALHDRVSERQHFVPFSLEYLRKEFAAFAKDGQVSIFFARYKGEIAAGSFVVFWSGIGFYHHAISVPAYAKLSAPYILQWEAIREAKRRGCALYDFWGFVDPKLQPEHPWAGPTLFKMGYGGEAHLYVKTRDLPLSWKYWITYIFETARRWKRHL